MVTPVANPWRPILGTGIRELLTLTTARSMFAVYASPHYLPPGRDLFEAVVRMDARAHSPALAQVRRGAQQTASSVRSLRASMCPNCVFWHVTPQPAFSMYVMLRMHIVGKRREVSAARRAVRALVRRM